MLPSNAMVPPMLNWSEKITATPKIPSSTPQHLRDGSCAPGADRSGRSPSQRRKHRLQHRRKARNIVLLAPEYEAVV